MGVCTQNKTKRQVGSVSVWKNQYNKKRPYLFHISFCVLNVITIQKQLQINTSNNYVMCKSVGC